MRNFHAHGREAGHMRYCSEERMSATFAEDDEGRDLGQIAGFLSSLGRNSPFSSRRFLLLDIFPRPEGALLKPEISLVHLEQV